jgi:hypothetical protein
MSRISALLVAAGLLAGSGGCAQCDHCDDFPAPCTGPNCAGAYSMNPTSVANRGGTDPGAAPATMSPAKPSDDSAGPIPPPPTIPGDGGAGEASPPRPTLPGERTRPGF